MNAFSSEISKISSINCTIRIEYDDLRILHATAQALIPEEQSIPTNRVVTHITRTDTSILLHFNAFDLVSLRAAVNSYLRWLISIRNVLKTISKITDKDPL